MKNAFLFSTAVLLLIVDVISADTFGTGDDQFTIDFVPISGTTNPTSGYGIVNNDYRMGTYEITNGQWNKFKDAYGRVTGNPSDAYNQNPYLWSGTNLPTNNVSWYEAAQFVNWLNTSAGNPAAYKFTGTQGTGDYTLGVWESGDVGYDPSNPYRNSNAYYFLPTENEWVKAAYWNGTNLQTYATIDNSMPIAKLDSNYSPDFSYNEPWNVGDGSEELNGTYDMMGNVFEWMESSYNQYSSSRCIRGGSCGADDYNLRSSSRGSAILEYEFDHIGFRVASVVPEPATVLLFGIGVVMMRRRK